MDNNTKIIITGSILGIGALIGLGVYLYNLQVSKPVNEIVVQVVSDLTDPCTVAEKATGSLFSWLTEITIQALNCGAIFEPHYGIALGVLGMSVLRGLPNIKPSSVSKPSLDGKAFLLTKCGLLSQLMLAGDTTDAPVGDAIGEGSSSLERVPSPSDSQIQVSTALLFTPPGIQASNPSVPSPAYSLAYICSQGGEESSSSSTHAGSSGASVFEGAPGLSNFQGFAGLPAFQKFAEFLAAQEFAVQEMRQTSFCAARHDSGTVLAYAHAILGELTNALDRFDAMLSPDGIPANAVNVGLWKVARVDVKQFADQIRSAEGSIIQFERQNRSISRQSYNLTKRKFVDELNNKFRVLPRAPLDALANIANNIKNYEANKNSKRFFIGIDLTNFIKLYKQQVR